MRKFFQRRVKPDDMLSSRLFGQTTFYNAFAHDLSNCTEEVIIESPFITSRRMAKLLPVLTKLSRRGVRIVINTRNPEEHDGVYQYQAAETIGALQNHNALVLFTAGNHRKVAILDRRVIWEGSLNILSQNDTCEIMRRIMSISLAQQMIRFLKHEKYLIAGRS